MKQYLATQKSADHRSEDIAGPAGEPVLSSVPLISTNEEFALLKMKLGEVGTSLEKAQRRIERLLGERNQLKVLLDKRDEQIQHLNRELGAHHGSQTEAAPNRSTSSFWRNLVPTLIKSIGTTGRTVRQHLGGQGATTPEIITEPAPSGFRRPPLLVNYKKASPQAVLVIVMFGLGEDEIKNMLPVIQQDSKASNMMPLVLTDHDAFELFREHGMIFEYLPPAKDREQFGRQLSWDLYIQRRLAIIRQKWQPTRVIAIGQVATDMLRLWHQSPFEEIPLPAVVKD